MEKMTMGYRIFCCTTAASIGPFKVLVLLHQHIIAGDSIRLELALQHSQDAVGRDMAPKTESFAARFHGMLHPFNNFYLDSHLTAVIRGI